MKKLAIFTIAFAFVACGKPSVPNNGSVDIPASPATSTLAPQGITSQGTINGGGGVGIRCGEHLEVLDLYEARKAGLKFPELKSQDEAVKYVGKAIARHFWNIETIPPEEHAAILANEIIAPIFEGRDFMNFETEKTEHVRFVDSLPLSNDFGNYELPPGCSLEQIAFYADDGRDLAIVKGAWAQLDWLSKGFLAGHEVSYMIDRRDGLEKLWPQGAVRTSESTRYFIGQLLSTKSLTPKSESIPLLGKRFRCASEERSDVATYLYAFKDENGKLTLAFKTLLGKTSFYQLLAKLEKGNGTSEITAVESPRKTRLSVSAKAKDKEQYTFSFFYTGEKGTDKVPVGTQEITCETI